MRADPKSNTTVIFIRRAKDREIETDREGKATWWLRTRLE